MGVSTTLALFEQTVGLSYDNQRYILTRIKDMHLEDKAAVAMAKSWLGLKVDMGVFFSYIMKYASQMHRASSDPNNLN